MKRYRLKTWVVVLFITIFLAIITFSCYNLLMWKKGVNDNHKTIKDTKKYIKKENGEISIDFKDLKKLNPDVIAYIKVNNTNVNYVVVRTSDNDYYLDHNFNKKYSKIGWIFADYRNKLDETDNNIIIYGHNTKDGSMFGSLKKTLNKSWQNDKGNRIVTLVTEEKEYKYEVFSTYIIEPEDYYITTNFNSNKEYLSFLNELKARSNNNYNVELDYSDKILTLSTCTSGGKKRVVLHAKLVNK